VPHHAFGQFRRRDQAFEIDSGIDAHLVAQKHQILGADIAGGGLAATAREWTAAQPRDR
jgi:hypothetical protein